METIVALAKGRGFVYAGSDAGALALRRPGDETVDLGGQFVCPGFNDSHMHLLNYGNALHSALLSEHTGSLKDLKECFRSFMKEHPPKGNAWVISVNMHFN